MINIDKSEITVNLNNLTQLQSQLMQDICVTAQRQVAGDASPAQLLAASEQCAVDSYGARTPTGPSGELAAVYRAIGRALVGRPVVVSDAPASEWRAKDIHATRKVGDFHLYADEEGCWSVAHYATRHNHWARGRVPEQKNGDGTLWQAQRAAEGALTDMLRATLALLGVDVAPPTTVYVVGEDVPYEGSSVVAVYRSEADADARAAQVTADSVSGEGRVWEEPVL